MESNGFKTDGYHISAINRIDMKGGGLALTYGTNVTVTKVAQKKNIDPLSQCTGGSTLEIRL